MLSSHGILGNRKNLQSKELNNRIKKKMFINLAIIPSLYVISTGLHIVILTKPAKATSRSEKIISKLLRQLIYNEKL